MRITVNLDDEIHEMASMYAAAHGITLGSALGDLIRGPHEPTRPSRMVIGENGLPLPSTGRVQTVEMVKAAQEDEV